MNKMQTMSDKRVDIIEGKKENVKKPIYNDFTGALHDL